MITLKELIDPYEVYDPDREAARLRDFFYRHIGPADRALKDVTPEERDRLVKALTKHIAMSYSHFPYPYDPFPTVRPPAPKLGDKHPDKKCKKCGNAGHITTAQLNPTVLICKLCGKEEK